MRNDGIAAACPACGAVVALAVRDGTDIAGIHVGFVRLQAEHAATRHGHNLEAALSDAAHRYPQAYEVRALQEWRDRLRWPS
jgi:hypothetical protein